MDSTSFKEAKAAHESGSKVVAKGSWVQRDRQAPAFNSLFAWNGSVKVMKFGRRCCQLLVNRKLVWAYMNTDINFVKGFFSIA